MRILFAGTPDIAVPSLLALAKEFDVCAVLTNPDRATGRGRKILFSPVKEAALELGIPVLQPEKLDETFLEEVRAMKIDLLAFFAFGKIFRKSFLDLFPMGGINLHPSLLPKYRGPSPLNEAIRNGDTLTGITVQKAALKMDSGDIILQRELKLDGSETTGSLSENVSHLAAPMMVEAVKILEDNPRAGIAQDEAEVTFCKLISKDEGRIVWSGSALEIERKIRAFKPWPGSYCWYGDKKLNILEATHYKGDISQKGEPGEVLALIKKEGLIIQTGDGALSVQKLQLQSKKPMDYQSFINGNRNFVGSKLLSDQETANG